MTNIYRRIFYFIIFSIAFIIVLATILVGILIKNTTITIILSFISIFIINAGLALWITTSNMRMVHTKLAWLLSFLVFPIISTIIYLIWGRMPYYAKSVADFKEEYKKYLKYYDSNFDINDQNDTFDMIAKYIHGVRSSCVFCNNKIDVIKDNIDFYKNMIDLIDSAKKTIVLCYYVIDDGQFWSSIKNHLIAKANSGVKIFILFDRYGSKNKFTHQILVELLQNKNINVKKFESDRDIWTRSANNFRSHKKSLIIDNDVVLYGGSNLADEYLSIKKNSPNWNDLNFIIKGDIVRSFLIDFSIDWDFNGFLPFIWEIGDYINCKKEIKWILWLRFHFFFKGKKQIYINAIKNRQEKNKILSFFEELKYFEKNNNSSFNDENKAIFVQTGPRYYNNVVVDILLTSISNAKKSVKIVSPYLQLNDTIMTAIVAANKRGVSIELLTADSADDKWWLLDMNRSIYPQLLNSGSQIYEYFGFIHSKLVIVDNEYILFGTFNLDFRSFNSNFETLLVVKEKDTINNVLDYWEKTINYSKKYSKYELFKYRNLRSIIIQTGLQIIQPLL